MRLLIGLVALVPIAAACSSDEGAVFVLHGGSAATKVEIVLASPTVNVKVQQRHRGDDLIDLEDVRYYKQLSTSKMITDLGSIDGATVRLEPNPSAESFVPFVFAYAVDGDGNDTLVAAGRIHQDDAEHAPIAIEIPEGRLDRYDVDLEPIELPDQTGIVANRGQLVRCRSNELRGLAWRFAKGLQLRLILPLEGALSAMDRELDLDCDAHDVETGADCDDLMSDYNPAMVEAGCNSPDYNCDGQVTSEQVCLVAGECKGFSSCDDPGLCVPSSTPECRCIANECVQGGCRIEKTEGDTLGTIHQCQPAIAEVHQICTLSGSQCLISVKQAPPDWLIQVGKPDDQGPPTFDQSVILTPGDVLLIRASQPPSPDMPPPTNSSFGEIDLEIRVSGNPVVTRALIDLFLAFGPPSNLECPGYFGPGGTRVANSMECSF